MEQNLAVLIDFENIAAGTEKEGLGRFDVEALMARIKDKGRILVSRSYADWGRFARFKQSLLMSNVTMYELTSHGMQDKNRADIAMVVDALELCFTKDYIDTFVIVSGDSDFTPLVLKMRELGKSVIGCGTRSSTSRLLIQACDEFFFYDSIAQNKRRRKSRRSGKKAKRKKQGDFDIEDAFDLLDDAITGLQRENPEPPLASVVKSAMLRKSPDFSEGDYKFSSFGRFLEKARDEGHVKLFRDEKSGGYRVDGDVDAGGRGGDKKPDQDSGGTSDDDGAWMDPYVPDEAHEFVETLAADNYNPLGAPTRLALLETLEEVVQRREKRRRRVNVQFVQDDVINRMKKTHAHVPKRGIRAVFNALMRAGVFMHRDGTPVRTGKAGFSLEKDAAEINKALMNVYLDILHGEGADLSDTEALAGLFLGNDDRAREVEEIVAWLHASDVDEEAEDEADDEFDALLEIDEDDLLEIEDDEDDEEASGEQDEEEEEEEEDDDDEEASDEDEEEEEEDDAELDAEAARKKAEADKLVAATEKAEKKAQERKQKEAEEAEVTETVDDSHGKPKTIRRRRKKKADDEPADDASDEEPDAALETAE